MIVFETAPGRYQELKESLQRAYLRGELPKQPTYDETTYMALQQIEPATLQELYDFMKSKYKGSFIANIPKEKIRESLKRLYEAGFITQREEEL